MRIVVVVCGKMCGEMCGKIEEREKNGLEQKIGVIVDIDSPIMIVVCGGSLWYNLK